MIAKEIIKQTISNTPIVLFMKGTPDFPQCGFSSKVVHVLRRCGAKFKSVNVLENPDIREGIKDFSNWPTIPQLYVNAEFVGGCDIVLELFESGNLKKMVTHQNTKDSSDSEND